MPLYPEPPVKACAGLHEARSRGNYKLLLAKLFAGSYSFFCSWFSCTMFSDPLAEAILAKEQRILLETVTVAASAGMPVVK